MGQFAKSASQSSLADLSTSEGSIVSWYSCKYIIIASTCIIRVTKKKKYLCKKSYMKLVV